MSPALAMLLAQVGVTIRAWNASGWCDDENFLEEMDRLEKRYRALLREQLADETP